MPTLHEFATITSKGQITLPKPIRQALGVDTGSKVAFDLHDDGHVTVSRAETEHEDPVISAFLTLLVQDIQHGRNVQGLPDDLTQAMLLHAQFADLSEDISGDVVI